MHLPKLSNAEIGCYRSKTSVAASRDGEERNSRLQFAAETNQRQIEYDAICHQLAELKTEQDYLRQTLRKVGEQILVLTQSSGEPASVSG